MFCLKKHRPFIRHGKIGLVGVFVSQKHRFIFAFGGLNNSVFLIFIFITKISFFIFETSPSF